MISYAGVIFVYMLLLQASLFRAFKRCALVSTSVEIEDLKLRAQAHPRRATVPSNLGGYQEWSSDGPSENIGVYVFTRQNGGVWGVAAAN